MNNLQILKEVRLGDGVAENEQKDLAQYFVETDSWARLKNGEVDIIYGSKGTGKSALYLLMMDNRQKMKAERKINLIGGENVSEAPVFQEVAEKENLDESDYLHVWKLYILALLGNYIRESMSEVTEFKDILARLEKEGLIPVTGLKSILKAAKAYVERVKPAVKHSEVEYSISLSEPSLEEEKGGKVSAQSLLKEINGILEKSGQKIWVLFDRLDVAFTNPSSETPALRGLFRVYRDFAGFEALALKIFLRDDIWERITRSEGFRESSHITKTLTIDWPPATMRHLIVSRFMNNEAIEKYIGLKKEIILANPNSQETALKAILPPQVETD